MSWKELGLSVDRFVTSSRGVAWLGVLAAVGAMAGALVFAPAPGDPEHVTLLGHPWRQVCTFRALTGHGCASCGMTRAWVWAVRGELGVAVRHSVAGVALLAMILGHGGLRAAQLAGWIPGRQITRYYLMIGVAWIALWLGSWAARLAGLYPLP